MFTTQKGAMGRRRNANKYEKAFSLNPISNFVKKPLVRFVKNSFSAVWAALKTIEAPIVAAQIITAAAIQPNKAPPASVKSEAMGSDKATVRIYVIPNISRAVANCLSI